MAELHRITVSALPHWSGLKPLTYAQGSEWRALNYEIPCASCGKPVIRPAHRVRAAVKARQTIVTCNVKCRQEYPLKVRKVDTLQLDRLPADLAELHHLIVTKFPHWAGPEPLTFAHCKNAHSLMVEIPCVSCRKPIIHEAYKVRQLIRNGNGSAACSRECREENRTKSCRIDQLKLERLPESLFELHETITSAMPQWAGKQPLTYARGGRSAVLYIEVPCAHCQTPVIRNLAMVLQGAREGYFTTFCGASCQGESRYIHDVRSCETCGKPLERDRCGKLSRATYCSMACVPSWSKLPKIPCPVCGKIFQKKYTRRQHCSRECADLAHSRRMQGDGNSHYKDGQSYSLWFMQMRPLIIERDGGCVVCGAAEKPDIHHINEQPADNRAENLIMLCRQHHIIHHKSHHTSYPWLAQRAMEASALMSSSWRDKVASLRARFSSPTI